MCDPVFLGLATSSSGGFGNRQDGPGCQLWSEARANIQQAPSAYLNKSYYDCLIRTEPALRMLIDTVGAERVVLGPDWPCDMGIDWPVSWVWSLASWTQ